MPSRQQCESLPGRRQIEPLNRGWAEKLLCYTPRASANTAAAADIASVRGSAQPQNEKHNNRFAEVKVLPGLPHP